MKNETHIGMNRTGIGLSPIDSREMIEGALEAKPIPPGDERLIDEVRVAYASAADGIGSVPPPTTLRGAAGALVKLVEGENLAVFVDKLGERLAFERTGTRLYDALIAKYRASQPMANGPTLDDLEMIRLQEHAHFQMLKSSLDAIGADPTALTPSANVAAVSSLGLPQVLTDPRTSFTQCLNAILVAELVDNDGWTILIQLADQLGYTEMAEGFRTALEAEQVHLANVRRWLMGATLREGAALH